MKKLLTVALLLATMYAFSQSKNLSKVYFVKPKMGQASAWEVAWKAHVAKFYNTEDKVNVYEVLSGPNAGTYHEIHGPMSYADMDKERTNQAAHYLDWEKTVVPKLEFQNGPMIMGYRDTLSFNTNIQADKFLVTVYHVKQGKMSDFLEETKRAATANMKRNAPFGLSTYIQNFAGSDPVVVNIRSLKDGFKELETNYFNRPQNEMRDTYVKEFSQAMWDKRTNTFLQDNTNSTETFLIKHRKDLSSKQ